MSSPSPAVPFGPAQVAVTDTPTSPGSPASTTPSRSTSYQTVSPSEAPVVTTVFVCWSSSDPMPLFGVESTSAAVDAVSSAVVDSVPAVMTRATRTRVCTSPSAIGPMFHRPGARVVRAERGCGAHERQPRGQQVDDHDPGRVGRAAVGDGHGERDEIADVGRWRGHDVGHADVAARRESGLGLVVLVRQVPRAQGRRVRSRIGVVLVGRRDLRVVGRRCHGRVVDDGEDGLAADRERRDGPRAGATVERAVGSCARLRGCADEASRPPAGSPSRPRRWRHSARRSPRSA